MTANTKQIIAREWLVFLFALLVGFALTPMVFFHSYVVLEYTSTNKWEKYRVETGQELSDQQRAEEMESLAKIHPDSLGVIHLPKGYAFRKVSAWGAFFDNLFARRYWLETWGSILLVYLLVQSLRSIYWSIRILAQKK